MESRVLLLLVSAVIWGTCTASLTIITGEIGGEIVLSCTSTAENKTNVAWFMDSPNNEILGCEKDNSSESRFSRLNESSLLLSNLRLEDEGNYGCKDCSGMTNSTPHIHLNITSGPNNMTFRMSSTMSLPNGTLYTSVGSTIDFNCSSLSIPESNITILFSTEDKAPELFNQIYGTFLNFSLINVARDYQGNYTCLATNPHSGRIASSTRQLLIYYPPASTIQCSARNNDILSELSLICSWTGGYPAPKLEWQMDGKILSNATSDTLVITLNGSQYIDKTFICQGKYYVREEIKMKTCQVQLKSPLPQSMPKRTCLTGDNVTFSCSTTGANPPAKITWLHNLSNPDAVIKPGKKYQITQNETISYLTIVNCSSDGDEGNYICNAENALAMKEVYIWLDVNQPHNIVGLVSGLLVLFLIVVALITGIILYCDPQVYLKGLETLRSWFW